MLEEQLAFYLDKYLGNYVKGLSKEALKVSVWQGKHYLLLLAASSQIHGDRLMALFIPRGITTIRKDSKGINSTDGIGRCVGDYM